MPKNQIHLHICDDHPLIATSIHNLFKDNLLFKSISSSISKLELFDALKQSTPDILILDINVNGVNMLDELPSIKEICADVKIIILTSYDSQNLLREAMKLGVDAYLYKNTDIHELLEAIDSLIKNEVYVSSGTNKEFQHKDGFELVGSLTDREKEVIRFLLEGSPNKKIADNLKISVTTVQTHRRNIYKKLNLKGIGELMSFAFENKLH